jgi:signal transduction histidine kinase
MRVLDPDLLRHERDELRPRRAVSGRLDRRAPAGLPARRRLEAVESELGEALDELRELARGIHPAVLTERGLPEALESLAVRSPVPVEIEQAPSERLDHEIEAAVYFVVAEALTSVARYAQARVASVRVYREADGVVAEIEDDGIGGADASNGSGLRGLADRVDALDGTVSVDSPSGGPTIVRAFVPV